MFAPQLSSLAAFDHHLHTSSFLSQHTNDMPYPPLSIRDDTDERIKQDIHDSIHLPHPLPQPDPYYHHSHDPTMHYSSLGLNIQPSIYPSYLNHPDHLSMQHYPQDNMLPLSQLPAPVLSHEYLHSMIFVYFNIWEYISPFTMLIIIISLYA